MKKSKCCKATTTQATGRDDQFWKCNECGGWCDVVEELSKIGGSMRDIKFRYWNSIINKMIYEPDIRRDYAFSLNDYLNTDRGWNWMQYIGLKDENGVEIYEGDIIKKLNGGWASQHLGSDEEKSMTHEQYLDSLTDKYEVVFSKGEFVGKRHTGYNPWETDDEGFTYTKLIADKHGYIEVIGNIYSNPELLESTK